MQDTPFFASEGRAARDAGFRGLSPAYIAFAMTLLPGLVMQFKPPSLPERLAAIGDTENLPPALRRALTPDEGFAPVPVPSPDDWLANQREDGQTFDAFLRARPNRPDEPRHKLYLQPLGAFPPGESPLQERLRDFAATFFMLEVEVLPPLNLEKSTLTSRRNPYTGQRQLLTGDLLALLRRKLPADGYALLGITMVDLYPEPSWNFVFGQASLRERVGVYGFARFDPRFYGTKPPADWQSLLLRRSCKVLAHETAHLFGVEHCIYFHCPMNGSNHLAESDARAHVLRESFQPLWEYTSYHWAGCFLDGWLKRALRSRLAAIKTVARSIRTHQTLLRNWFVATKEFSVGIVGGLNYRVKLTLREAYGFRTL
jgi:archaemetzincin